MHIIGSIVAGERHSDVLAIHQDVTEIPRRSTRHWCATTEGPVMVCR
jgi:hypothetical protein